MMARWEMDLSPGTRTVPDSDGAGWLRQMMFVMFSPRCKAGIL